MAKAQFLTDGSGSKIYPVAHADAAYTRDGKLVGDLLSNVTDLKAQGTITAGDTTITFTDSSITDDAIIDVYFWDKVLAPTGLIRVGNSVTITIDSQETDTKVGIFVK